MSDDETICGRSACFRPADGWFLCRTCTDLLTGSLADVGWMLEQLDTVTAQQTRYTETAGKIASVSEVPLPLNLKAADARGQLVNELSGWALVIYDANPDMADEWPMSGPVSPLFCATWLASRIASVRLHPAAGEIADGIAREWAGCEWVIDRPPGRKYLGTCAVDWEGNDCGGRIYQAGGKSEARCDTCGGQYDDVEGLQYTILKNLDEHLATAAEIAELSTYMDLSINRLQVRKSINDWVRRKQLVPAQKNPETKFRFIEARVLLEKAEERRRAKDGVLQSATGHATMKCSQIGDPGQGSTGLAFALKDGA